MQWQTSIRFKTSTNIQSGIVDKTALQVNLNKLYLQRLGKTNGAPPQATLGFNFKPNLVNKCSTLLQKNCQKRRNFEVDTV